MRPNGIKSIAALDIGSTASWTLEPSRTVRTRVPRLEDPGISLLRARGVA